MSRGRRYNGEQKLNMKKVFAVIIAIAVIIMFIFVIKTLLSKEKGDKVIADTYYTCFENNKYGVINSKGEKVVEPSYAEYITIPNHKKAVFICTYDVDYTNETYQTKALNNKNEEIFKQYEQIEAIQNIDSNHQVSYEDNILKVRKDGKYGLINLDGKEILPCEYTNITTLKGVNGELVIEKEGLKGIAENTGKVVIATKYRNILPLGENTKLGYIIEKEENKYGVIDSSDKELVGANYEEIQPLSSINLFGVKENNKWKLINTAGEVIGEGKYDAIKAISQNQVIVSKGNNYGVISNTGEEIIPIEYQDMDFAFTDTFIFERENAYGIIKADGQELIPATYHAMSYRKQADFVEASNEEGIETDIIGNDGTVKLTGIISEVNSEKGYFKIRMGDNYQYYNFKFEEKKAQEVLPSNNLFLAKQDGKYGYVDKDGKIIVNYDYEDATEQNTSGYVSVKKDGKWGSLDKNGKVVLEPSLSLENSIRVDFIGSWHLGQDINMNYYTK